MKTLRQLAFFIVVLCASMHAVAWNMAGHMLTGAFVYQELKRNNPALLQEVIAILKEHPEYDTRWAAPLSRAPDEDQDQVLLMLAARWPDDARDDPDEHRPTWHYVSFPYGKGPWPMLSVNPAQQPSNLVQAFNLVATAVAARANGDADRAQRRAIALCWLLHLAGDAHQPLHAVSYFSNTYPKGDKGGNMQYVRPDRGGAPVNLHSLWDGLVIGSQRFRQVQREAGRLRGAYPASSYQEVGELDPVVWTRSESYPLAKSEAYLSRTLRTSPDESRAPVLPDGYLATAKQVAERRISLAGHRISGVLTQLLSSP